MEPSISDFKYSVSIKAMDTQHREIAGILDELAARERKNESGGSVNQLLDILFEKVKEHFDSEEALMRDNRYPSYLLHKSMHDAFLRQLSNFRTKVGDEPEAFTKEGLSLLKRWFIDHILGADKLYSPFLIQRGIS